MSDIDQAVETLKDESEKIAEKGRPVLARLARLGFMAKGVIYLTLGLLAFRAVFGLGSPDIEKDDVLLAILLQPFGGYLLLATAIGLAGYVLWRLVQALVDTERLGLTARGVVERVAFFVSALAYASLIFAAVRLLLGHGPAPDSDAAEHWTARVLMLPVGPWFVGLAGVVVFGLGVYQYFTGLSKGWKKKFKLREMNPGTQRWVSFAGKVGIPARGIVYNVIGLFLIRAAFTSDPNQAGGLGDAFLGLALPPFGPWALGIVAVGLVTYGLYSILGGWFYEISIEK